MHAGISGQVGKPIKEIRDAERKRARIAETAAIIEDWLRSHPKGDVRDPLMNHAAKVMSAWKAGKPIFREAAAFREVASAPLVSQDHDWFSEIVEDPRYMRSVSGESLNDIQTAMSTWVSHKLRLISTTANWFRPSEGLTYKLIATDLRGAVVGDLKLPMKSFYIELPPNLFFLEDSLTGWHEVRSLVITQGVITEKTVAIAKKHADPTAAIVELGERLVVEAYGEPNENSTNPFDDTWLFKTYQIQNKEEDIEAAAARSTKGDSERERAMNRGRLGERLLDGLEVRNVLLKFVLNFCIYLGTERGTAKHIHKDEIERLHQGKKFKNLRAPVQEKIRRLQNDRVFEVGTEVKVDEELREIVRTEGTGGYRLTYRTLVRGHWRNQAHGPARALRTRKWIEPHVRGTELPTKVVGHTYEIK